MSKLTIFTEVCTLRCTHKDILIKLMGYILAENLKLILGRMFEQLVVQCGVCVQTQHLF
jgi:hypothetical protein